MVNDAVTEAHEHFLVGQGIGAKRFAPGVADVVRSGQLSATAIVEQHIRPFIVQIDIAGIVEHIEAQPAWRAHVDFERHQPPVGSAKELEVEEAFAHIERSEEAAPACSRSGGMSRSVR